MGETACGRQVVAVLLPMCSVECAWPGVCLNYTLSVESARKSSPCGVNWFGKREKVRPAREKWLDFGVFGRAGRVFSRFGQGEAVAGRVYSRGNGWRGALGEFFRGLAKVRLLLGELFRAGTVGGACWESFFAVWPRLGCCWANFFARERLEALAGRTFSRGNGWMGVLGELFRALALSGHPPARRDGANRQQLADDGLLFRHADDAGALAQGQGRGHGHGAGAAREHEENQHVFGAHGQDWGDAGGQADGREC